MEPIRREAPNELGPVPELPRGKRPDVRNVQSYLSARFGATTRLIAMTPLGEWPGDEALKVHGYGAPMRVDFELKGETRSAVLETLKPGPFGHEHMADRAQSLLWSHRAFNRLPRHTRSLDVGGFTASGELVSLGHVEELFGLNEYVEGREYVHDLERLRNTGELTDLDVVRADALCDYLLEIHRTPGPDPGLYVRRIRELVGHSECIMGVIDSYPAGSAEASAEVLEAIEHDAVRWRWRLKPLTHRLRQVHGDFHPWNVLFREGADFTILDRARGEWGEPADDVASMIMNYFFFALQAGDRQKALDAVLHRFWKRYLERSRDEELPRVVAPFLAFRGLVMASPVWYPSLEPSVRRQLLAFVRQCLASTVFDPESALARVRA